MAKNAAEFTQELMDAAGLSDAEQKKQLEAIFNNDKVKAKVQNVFSDIESANGRAIKANDEAKRVYEENLKIFANNKAAVEAAEKRVQSYVEKFGELPGGGDPANPTARAAAVNADVIDKKTFDERIKVTEDNTLGLFTTGLKLLDQFRREFPDKEFKTDEILKIATEQKLTADKAFDEWVRPMRSEREKAANEAAIKKAREEGEMEGRSKVAASVVADPERSSPFMANLRKSGEVKEGPRESFVRGWRESAQKSTGT